MRKRASSVSSVGSGGSTSSKTVNAPTVGLTRGLMIVVIIVMGVVLALSFHKHLTIREEQLAQDAFARTAQHALATTESLVAQWRHAAAQLAAVAGANAPASWPVGVTISGFEQGVASHLIQACNARDVAFVPLVPTEIQTTWEAFANNFLQSSAAHHPSENHNGGGIWATINPDDDDVDSPDNYYRMVNGTLYNGTQLELVAPIFQAHGQPSSSMLLYNLYAHATQRRHIDQVLACASRELQGSAQGSAQPPSLQSEEDATACAIMGPAVSNIQGNNNHTSQMAALYQPIYPGNRVGTESPVGLIVMHLEWQDLLTQVFANSGVSGVNAVVLGSAIDQDDQQQQQQQTTTTYRIFNGAVEWIGTGDAHEEEFAEFVQSADLWNDDVSSHTTTYRILLYPNAELYNVYSTANPLAATTGAICILLITTLFVFLYDFFVNRELTGKNETLDARRHFMRFVSHEVRTPLNSVVMGIAVIQGELATSLGYQEPNEVLLHHHSSDTEVLGPDDKVDKATETDGTTSERERALDMFFLAQEIKTSAMGAVDVLSDLLHYDKIESGQLQMETTIVPIWKVVQRVWCEFKLPAANKKVTFGLRFVWGNIKKEIDQQCGVADEQDLPLEIQKLQVIGDTMRISQILRIVLSNGIKFTPKGGKLEVTAELIEEQKRDKRFDPIVLDDGSICRVRKRGSLHIRVVDTGVGMSPVQLAQLFHEGKQFNPNKLQAGQGSGLGLFIARGIAEQHDGCLVASSAGEGLGSTFTLTLPLWDIQEEKEVSPRDTTTLTLDSVTSTHFTEECQPSIRPTGKLRVLVVDDVKSNRRLLSRLLAKKGHFCEEAENGAVALDKMIRSFEEGHPYDSVVMDYEMPVLNGPCAAQEIRKLGLADVYIAGVTGNVLPEDIKHFIACGANAVLPKPVKIDALEDLWAENLVATAPDTNPGVAVVENVEGVIAENV